MSARDPVSDVRPSPLAGKWYPGSPERLAQSIDAYLDQAEVAPVEGRIVGVLAPHAGHRIQARLPGTRSIAARRGDEVVASSGRRITPIAARS